MAAKKTKISPVASAPSISITKVSPVPYRDPDIQQLIERRLPELANLERLLKNAQDFADIKIETTVRHDGIDFPIYSLVMGSKDKSAPTLAMVGGVHGLERIGSEVCISWLQSISELMTWDGSFRERLEHSRLIFMPVLNPVGMYLSQRSNGNGVDLMRNSPVEADAKPGFIIGGQTISNRLPFYRGKTGSPEFMEAEAKALCAFVERELFPSRVSLAVDLHSGFGTVDRLWFPYAKTRQAPPHLAEITALKMLFDRTYPNHFYRIEPQAVQYTTHGDLWDWLYDRHQAEAKGRIFVPWALELGSWLWMKKNPRQVFSPLGVFNPIQPHRLRRILRRHITLFDFLQRALLNADTWTKLEPKERARLERRAMDQWYAQTK